MTPKNEMSFPQVMWPIYSLVSECMPASLCSCFTHLVRHVWGHPLVQQLSHLCHSQSRRSSSNTSTSSTVRRLALAYFQKIAS